ncbi:MAG: MFS transporter [Burkholderiaceae bacterium]
MTICVLSVCNHVVLTGGRITVSLAALQMGLSPLNVGLLVAVFAILPMLLSVHVGRWIDGVGLLRPMAFGTAMVACGAAIPFIFQTPFVLLAAAAGIGLGFMVQQVAIQNILGQAEPTLRLRNFSWLSLGLAMSGFIGPLGAGLAIDNLGYQSAFGMLTAPPLIALTIILYLRHRLHAVGRAKKGPREAHRKASDLLSNPGLRRVLLCNLFLSGAWDTHLFVVPLYGVSIGLSATTIGIILSAFAGATFVIRLALPWIQKRVAPWTLVRTSMIVTAADFMLYPFFTSVFALMTMSFILGLALGGCQPTMLSMLHQHSPAGRAAEAGGLRMALVNASQVTLPLICGAMGTVVGVTPLFWVYALMLSGGIWINRNPPVEAPKATTDGAPNATPDAAPDAAMPADTKAAAQATPDSGPAPEAATGPTPVEPAVAVAADAAPANKAGTTPSRLP